MEILIRIVGMAGFLLMITSFQMNTRRGILGFQVASSFCFLVQFLLLGATTGAILNIISATRCITYIFKGKNKLLSGPFLPSLMITACLLTAYFTYDGPVSLLPCAAMILTSISMWQSEPKMVRLIGIPGNPMWLIYNIFCHSWEGVLTESFCIASIIIGMIRFDFKKTSCKVEKSEKQG